MVFEKNIPPWRSAQVKGNFDERMNGVVHKDVRDESPDGAARMNGKTHGPEYKEEV